MIAVNLHDYQRDCRPEDLTIVSVSFRTARLLRRNMELTKQRNPGVRFWWIVVDNSADESESQSLADADGFVVIPGTQLTAAERRSILYGSLHHAKSLNVGIAYARSDTILVLDPDCFLVLDDWIARVRRLMDEREYVFWGTPYHPERLANFNVFGRTNMYFPTAICMFIDRARLQNQHKFDLDFTPPVEGRFSLASYQNDIRRLSSEVVNGRMKSRIKTLMTLVSKYGVAGIRDACRLTAGMWAWDRRCDIGYDVYAKYHRFCRHGHTTLHYARSFPRLFQWWKRFVPQGVCGYPKEPGFWRPEGFPFVPSELVGQGRWEQFYLGDEPFALHIGKVTYCGDPRDADTLDSVLRAAEVRPHTRSMNPSL